MEEITNLLGQYLSPEIVFLIPFLLFLGTLIKKSVRIKDSLIPTILIVVAIPLAMIFAMGSHEVITWDQKVAWVVTSIGQGVFAGLSSVGIHQVFKQHAEYRDLRNWDGEVKEKEEINDEYK